MDKKTATQIIEECGTIVATGLATPTHKLPADEVITWVKRHPNSALYELIDWSPQADAETTATHRRGQLIDLLDRLTVHASAQ